MSVVENDRFIEQMWEQHREGYLKWCRDNSAEFDLGDFWVYLEDNDLIPGDLEDAG